MLIKAVDKNNTVINQRLLSYFIDGLNQLALNHF